METQETSGLFDGDDIRRLLTRAADLWDLAVEVGDDEAEPPAGAVRLQVGRRDLGWLAARAADGAAPDPALVEFLGDVVATVAEKEKELQALSSDLVDRYEEITLLYDLARNLGSVFDEPATCAAGAGLATDALSATRVCLALAGDDETLRVAASPGWPEPPPVGEMSLAAAVIERGKPVLLHPEEQWEDGAATDRPGGEAALALPLRAPGDSAPLGAMVLAGGSARRFSSADTALASTIAEQVATALRSARQVAALREAERVRRELEIASEIQRSLLPASAPSVAGVVLAGDCLPAANVGGDYYDFMVDPSGAVHLVVADVSGHSVGSALLMAVGRSMLRREMASGAEPVLVIRRTGAALYDDLVGAGLFITAFAARYDPSSHRLLFASAGHNPPLLYRPADDTFTLLDADGTPAGFLDDFDYVQDNVDLAPGDVVVLYTDGVVEAKSPAGDQFGMDRFQDVIRAAHGTGAAGLTKAVEDAVERHQGDLPRADDLTVAVLEVQ